MAKKKKKAFPRKFKNQQGEASTSGDLMAPVDTEEGSEDDDDDSLWLAPSPGNQKLSSSRVVLVGMGLVGIGMAGFYYIPGLMAEDEKGDRLVNAFYCSAITLTTVGFGDICPSSPDFYGRVFLTVLALLGLGFFCGPILSMTSLWQTQVPGGVASLFLVTLAVGISTLSQLENMSMSDAIHLTVITGTTVGYGDITVSTDEGKLFLAVFAILICGMFGAVLDVSKGLLESLCKVSVSKKKQSLKKKTA
jgi:hypothetical protein